MTLTLGQSLRLQQRAAVTITDTTTTTITTVITIITMATT